MRILASEFTTITPNNIVIDKRSYDSEQNLYVCETYYDSGKIKEKYTVNNTQKKCGEYIKYYENDIIQLTCNYINNQIIDKSISYYDNEQVQDEIIYNKQINKIRYFKSGKVEEKCININNIRIKENYNENGLLINCSLSLNRL